jgi:ABC-type Fe3+/spermidine/putrescine transport system ATPase subunit
MNVNSLDTHSLGIRLDGVSAIFRHARREDVTAVRELDLDIRPGEFLTLLGASGCGKTTVLRMIAGFQRPSAGRVLFGERDVTGQAANRRDIGFVFQNYALFPHLSVFENVAYGLRVKRLPGSGIASAVEAGLRQVGLAGFGDRMISELSGGQQQRVALARAIVIQPRVLLFDEPLSNLDAQLRVQMRSEIRRLQRELKITTVYVTHDQEEAMAISDRIAIMNAGRIVQIGTAEELYRRPGTAFAATFLGEANLVKCRIVEVAADLLTLAVGDSRWTISSAAGGSLGAEVEAVVRPEAIKLSATGHGLPGQVVSATYLGSKVDYVVRIGDQNLRVVQSDPAAGSRFAEGAAVDVTLPQAGVQILAGTGR